MPVARRGGSRSSAGFCRPATLARRLSFGKSNRLSESLADERLGDEVLARIGTTATPLVPARAGPGQGWGPEALSESGAPPWALGTHRDSLIAITGGVRSPALAKRGVRTRSEYL